MLAIFQHISTLAASCAITFFSIKISKNLTVICKFLRQGNHIKRLKSYEKIVQFSKNICCLFIFHMVVRLINISFRLFQFINLVFRTQIFYTLFTNFGLVVSAMKWIRCGMFIPIAVLYVLLRLR